VLTLAEIRGDFSDRLDSLTPEEWRRLLITLDIQIHVRDRSNQATWSNDWLDRHYYMRADRQDIKISFALNLKREAVTDIAYERAESNSA
jgi:hypothetical protein